MGPDPRTAVLRAREAAAEEGTAARAIPLLDLTLLGETESEAGVTAAARRAVATGCAALCIWPRFLEAARPALEGSDVRLAAVANFPHGSDDIASAAREAAAAVAAGAQEIDLVAPIEAVMDGDVGLVGELVEAVRAAIGQERKIKLILETGALETPDRITAAARAGIMAGADFLKTSTGKGPPGASLEAAALLLAATGEADYRVGVKVSGGVRTAQDAARYLALADDFMGPDRVTRDRFRFGASGLLDDLLRLTGAGPGESSEAGSGDRY